MKGKAIDDFSNLKDDDLTSKCRLVYGCMVGNKFFPNPTPTMEVLIAGINTFDQAVQLAKSGDNVKRADRKAQRGLQIGLMKALLSYVNYTANGDRTMLASSGFKVNAEVKRSATETRKVELPVAKPGKSSGEQKLAVPAIKGAKSYLFQVTPTPVTTASRWTGEPSASKCTVKGLIRGTEYAARVCVRVAGDQILYSDTITFIAV